MTIDQVTNATDHCKPASKILGFVDRVALTVLFIMVVAGLPMTAVSVLTQVV